MLVLRQLQPPLLVLGEHENREVLRLRRRVAQLPREHGRVFTIIDIVIVNVIVIRVRQPIAIVLAAIVSGLVPAQV